jgi:rhodanese-related sulfurtransferase
MIRKIIGIFLGLMLLITAISVIGIGNEKFEEELTINISPVGFFGVNLEIGNTGETSINNVEWSFRSKPAITGTGFFINEKLQKGTINEIGPGEQKVLNFSPFGLGNIYVNASVEANGIYVRTQQRAFIFLILMLNLKDTYKDIKPLEAYQRLQENEFDLVIDVVGLDIYSLGHLPGAVNYVWADGTLNSKIPTLDPNLTYLVYCHTDPPSTASAQALIDAGIKDVYRLEGNYRAWVDAGFPVET